MEEIVGRAGSAAAAKGEAIKITRGLYLPREPTAYELAQVLSRHWPDSALDGYSAAMVLLERKPGFPLQLIREKGLEDTRFYVCRRARPKGVFPYDGINVCNPLQAVEAMEERHAVMFLEKFLAGRDAEGRLKLLSMDFRRFSQHTRRVLEKAVIGADSVPERALTRALEPFFRVRNNAKIGPYRWDLLLEEHKIAIEVDGYAYHRGENRRQFELDRQKLNDAVHRGYTPLHFTATTIEHHLDKVVEQVRGVAQGTKRYLDPPWMWHRFFV
ncbi:DUF559 domain-containing protein [Corynebacterium sp. FDAARGOS 1242]|uniref:DUF559 domain-containing protein n=1 Tax=Corynebacterium minutissimum TaxID=38301 RepID=A0A376D2Z2_9CORY|nr:MULTISPECIES: DUF559 domain-containing protein [Corynebacterium]QRP61790.1 DUF559 domain-containing protein [Corynebacterium minutissimum]QRP98031.1 DUF559 domain-containing protein [Corynebacterium sp. FDAARGOS 1242]STC81134.1 Uncharacterised protein [Corynebacterium minutissimum]